PPATNAAKAPGLWQELKIMFHAPVFDDKGNKISNARFEYVDLNGIRLHANLEVPLPTGGPISKGEAATGPIMIQGDHGPVAIRNIRYRLLKESDAGVSSLTCQVYKGEFRSSDDFKTPVRSMATSAIDVGLAESENAYGLLFKGQVEIKTTDTYTFTLGYSGGIKFVLAGKTMIDQPASSWWSRPETNITLEPGTYSFEIHNFKTDGWIPPRLGFFVRGSATYDKPFHAYDSYPEMNGLSSPIWVEPAGSPKLHRGFVAFRDNGPKLSHTIAVGDPSGVHYIYDLNAGNLISVWRGPFLDATPMWEDRGNGSFRPRGATQWTFRNQPLAYLTDSQSAFPETGEKPSFFSKGYQLDAETGQPVFRHFYNGMEILTRISPDPTETYLLHSLYLKEVDSFQNLYLKLAEGESIRQMPDGSYAINDQQYYIKMVSGQTPIIRRSGDVTELIIAVDSPAITYSIIW
ncbi:MAG: DUF1080 domain-containing protein, partial [Cyclobacteriaceae bacterium]|nr:DUF1080 domain-containing protein [Cyclobacteriaceae bacterium]